MIEYMNGTIAREAGSPLGGKMYIDGAYTLSREMNPDVICLLSSPRLSIQKGSASSLNIPARYAGNKIVDAIATAARHLRDEAWRRGLVEVVPKASSQMNVTQSAVSWPHVS